MDAKTKSIARRERVARELDQASKLHRSVDAEALLKRLQDVALGFVEVSKEEMDALKFLTAKVVPNLQTPASDHTDDGPGRGNVFVLAWSGQPIPEMKQVKGVRMDDMGLLIEDQANAPE